MNYIVLIQLAFFYGYIIYLWSTVGILKSISESWYRIKRKQLFNIFAAGVGLPMWSYSTLGFKDEAQMLFAAAGFFMFALSVASAFRSSITIKIIHYGTTGLAILFSILGIYVQSGDYQYLYLVLIGIALMLFTKHPIWWVEIVVFTGIIFKLLFL